MKVKEFISLILQRFGHEPTDDQTRALDVFAHFLAAGGGSGPVMPVMLLRGSAGTGKTSIVAAMVQTLLDLQQKVVLMAPTGRAAKVLAQNCGVPATTIHRKIYRQKTLSSDFSLDINLHTDTLFVVDEASMISTIPQIPTEGMPVFKGNGGGVIDDLITYVYSGRNCRMMLIGDTAQLPPIGEDEAPALQKGIVECYGLSAWECDLQEVVRQHEASGILWNATRIRHLITHDEATQLPKIRLHGFADIVMMPGNEIVEAIADSYHHIGMDDTVVITRSNKRANIYNNGIRVRVVDHEGTLCSGDRIMVVKNHYFDDDDNGNGNGNDGQRPLAPYSLRGGVNYGNGNGNVNGNGNDNGNGKGASRFTREDKASDYGMSFIANGDMAIVERVKYERELYGFHFADLTLTFPDYDDTELTMTAILDCLQSDAPALTVEEQKRLYDNVMEDYEDLPRKADRLKAIKKDPYYTALQIKFAYAITCHKAQGGQWRHVYIDQGYMTDDMLTPDYIHWLYTAFTRATEKLFLVNWPKEQTEQIEN